MRLSPIYMLCYNAMQRNQRQRTVAVMKKSVFSTISSSPTENPFKHYVMTERAAHVEWAKLLSVSPRAGMLLHHLVACMGDKNAVVISQSVLANIMGCSVETVKRAVRVLVKERWIQVVKIGKGKEVAYVVNSRVAWGQPRNQLQLSVFSASIVADYREQDEKLLGQGELKRIPTTAFYTEKYNQAA